MCHPSLSVVCQYWVPMYSAFFTTKILYSALQYIVAFYWRKYCTVHFLQYIISLLYIIATVQYITLFFYFILLRKYWLQYNFLQYIISLLGGPVLKLAKIKFAPNAIFRVVSCLYILYDLTYSFLWKNSNHSLSYKIIYCCFTVFFTSDWLVTH